MLLHFQFFEMWLSSSTGKRDTNISSFFLLFAMSFRIILEREYGNGYRPFGTYTYVYFFFF